MTVIDLPIVSNKRECETCTKCCEGWLLGDVRGHEMYPGKPCFFLEIGIGKPSKCGDYENRPEKPCKKYNCFWVAEDIVPDKFKPEICGVIMDIQKIKEFDVLRLTPAPNNPDSDVLTWAFNYAASNRLNMIWSIDEEIHWSGSLGFLEVMHNG